LMDLEPFAFYLTLEMSILCQNDSCDKDSTSRTGG
jgi:hypothetical protein